MHLPFAKYSGAGNDFIVLDNQARQCSFLLETRPVVQKLCHRKEGIGADGILLIEQSTQADVCVRILNADGSEAAMCGNGIRCAMKHLHRLGWTAPHYTFEVGGELYSVQYTSSSISVSFPSPQNLEWNIPLEIGEKSYSVDWLCVGVPHLVLFREEISSFPLRSFALEAREHPHFAPEKTNVTIASLTPDKQGVVVRTMERGVAEETGACGTGAVAAALAAAHHYELKSPLTVIPPSRDSLTVSFRKNKEDFTSIQLMGTARCTFEGSISLATIQST